MDLDLGDDHVNCIGISWKGEGVGNTLVSLVCLLEPDELNKQYKPDQPVRSPSLSRVVILRQNAQKAASKVTANHHFVRGG
jgi:hypothetical protein